MSVHSATSGLSPAHPIDQPEIAQKIQEFNEKVAKIRRMEPVTLFCVSTEHDSGSGMGPSSYTYTYYTSQEAANQHRLGFGDKRFDMSVVRDEYRDLYKVTFEPTLILTKLFVTRHFEEKQLYDVAQKEKMKKEEKNQLEQALAETQRKLASFS